MHKQASDLIDTLRGDGMYDEQSDHKYKDRNGDIQHLVNFLLNQKEIAVEVSTESNTFSVYDKYPRPEIGRYCTIGTYPLAELPTEVFYEIIKYHKNFKKERADAETKSKILKP